MNDRFKFRVYFKGSEYAKAGYQDLSRKDVIYSLKSDGQIIRNVVYECQQEGHEGSPCNMPFEPNNDLYDIQFCTGLKDKNGKLIYEGDIVVFYFDNDEMVGVISWSSDYQVGFYVNTTDYFKDKYITDYELLYGDKYEVIGNIYENEDLLKECE